MKRFQKDSMRRADGTFRRTVVAVHLEGVEMFTFITDKTDDIRTEPVCIGFTPSEWKQIVRISTKGKGRNQLLLVPRKLIQRQKREATS